MSSDDTTREPPTTPPVPVPRPSLGARALYMLVFALVFWILCWTLAITALAQLGLTALAVRPNPDVARFGAGLAAYSRQIIEFLTFASERIPYPFSGWPTL
ncbi:MAG: DUF4389 domain-containing protein [Steroidobacteraceae bacterium]